MQRNGFLKAIKAVDLLLRHLATNIFKERSCPTAHSIPALYMGYSRRSATIFDIEGITLFKEFNPTLVATNIYLSYLTIRQTTTMLINRGSISSAETFRLNWEKVWILSLNVMGASFLTGYQEWSWHIVLSLFNNWLLWHSITPTHIIAMKIIILKKEQ